MGKKFQIQLDMSRSDAEMERQAVTTSGDFDIQEIKPIDDKNRPPLVDASFIEPVSIIAAMTIAVLAKRFVEHWLNNREQGVQINLQKRPPSISRLAGVPLGFIVVLNKDGTTTMHKADYSKSEEIMPLLKSIFPAASQP